jgi:hypothetical protein
MSQLLAKEPQERYQTCSEVADDLALVRQGQQHKLKPRNAVANEQSAGKQVSARLALIIALVAVITTAAISFLFSLRLHAVDTPIANTRNAPTPTNSQAAATGNGSPQTTSDSDSAVLGKLGDVTPELCVKDKLSAAGNTFHYPFPQPLSDQALEQVRNNRVITDVNLLGQKSITDKGIECFTSSPVVKFHLRDTLLTNDGLKAICEKLSSTLEDLDISNTKVTDLRCLAKLDLLTTLKINGLGKPAARSRLPVLKNLIDLEGGDGALKDQSVAYVAKLPSLRRLKIFNTEMSDQSANVLARCSRLTELELVQLGITDKTLAAISHLHLHSLDLSATNVTKTGVTHLLEHMPSLQRVNLAGCKNISDADLKELKSRFAHCQIVAQREPLRA